MKQTKVSLTIRLTPELMAYVKQQGASNYSHFVSELIRKDALDNVQDDVVARLTDSIIRSPKFKDYLDWEVGRQVDARLDR